MDKSKRKTDVTTTERLSMDLAEALTKKIVVIGGRMCLRGDKTAPIDILAIGKTGADGADGYTPIKNKDYFDGNPGVAVSGADGKRGQPGVVGPSGPSGPAGATMFPKMKWKGTKLTINGLDEVDLRGDAGAVGGVGGVGRDGVSPEPVPGPAGPIGEPGILESEILDILARLERLETNLKLEKA